MSTQLEFARQGDLTSQMKAVAVQEGMDKVWKYLEPISQKRGNHVIT